MTLSLNCQTILWPIQHIGHRLGGLLVLERAALRLPLPRTRSRELPTVLTNYTSAKIGNKSWPNGRTIFGQIGELEKIICIFVVAIEVIQNGKSV